MRTALAKTTREVFSSELFAKSAHFQTWDKRWGFLLRLLKSWQEPSSEALSTSLSSDGVSKMWAVYFRDHIHQNIHGQLAIFATRKQAREWVKNVGMRSRSISRVVILDDH